MLDLTNYSPFPYNFVVCEKKKQYKVSVSVQLHCLREKKRKYKVLLGGFHFHLPLCSSGTFSKQITQLR